MTDLHYCSIRKLSDRLRQGEISPVDVTRAMLDRIEKLDGVLKSYVTVMADHALARARVAEDELRRGQWRGWLHGIPLAAKDLFYTNPPRA